MTIFKTAQDNVIIDDYFLLIIADIAIDILVTYIQAIIQRPLSTTVARSRFIPTDKLRVNDAMDPGSLVDQILQVNGVTRV